MNEVNMANLHKLADKLREGPSAAPTAETSAPTALQPVPWELQGVEFAPAREPGDPIQGPPDGPPTVRRVQAQQVDERRVPIRPQRRGSKRVRRLDRDRREGRSRHGGDSPRLGSDKSHYQTQFDRSSI